MTGRRSGGYPSDMATAISETCLELDADVSAPALARRGLAPLAAEDSDVARRLALLVTELVSNSVRHAALLPGDRIVVSGQRHHDRLRVEVVDAGRAEGMPRIRTTDPVAAEGGLGMRLVDQLASAWGAERVPGDGTRAWFELSA